jgi:hypothetical protein
MRYLAEGSHSIEIDCTRGTRASIVIRAVPEIVHANFPGDPHLAEFGHYDWEFLDRIGMLALANVIITGSPGEWARDWLGMGRRVLQQVGVPGLREGEEVTSDSSLEYWEKREGWISPWASGLIADEFLEGRDEKVSAWSDAIRRLTSRDDARVIYPYLGGRVAGLRPFIESVLDTPCRFAFERYLKEQPTEEDARDALRTSLKEVLLDLKKIDPDLPKRVLIVLGLLCGPPETLDVNPSVNYKVHMDRQFQMIATDPAFDGIYGIEEYLSSYADEEYLRWAARLYRHYCIEGGGRSSPRRPAASVPCDWRATDGWKEGIPGGPREIASC